VGRRLLEPGSEPKEASGVSEEQGQQLKNDTEMQIWGSTKENS
jgi:hypothetical protein